jgi:hypothetical protein
LRDRRTAGGSDDFGPGLPAVASLFADLENYTVANVSGYHRAKVIRDLYPKITVKIVRAHGGCLGTKSR